MQEPTVANSPPSHSHDSHQIALRVSHLHKTYEGAGIKESIAALRDISFDVRPGSVVTLIGPSGCGKTTLLKICASLVSITEGAVDWMGTGKPVPPGAYGMVFQTPALLPWRTVLANVLLPAQVLRLDPKAARDRALELLSLMKLDGTGKWHPSGLSGGMQQRVGIARALIHQPHILFMDEPFGALDAITRDALNIELQRVILVQGTTVMFVTHSIQEAIFLSDSVIVLSQRPSTIVARVEIRKPRPRTLEDLSSEDFRAAEDELRRVLADNGAAA